VPTNPRALAGEAALVTGASSGIGAAVAHELSRRGARVALAARRVDRLEAAAQAIRSAGGDAIAIPTDLADSSQVARLARCTIEEFGRIDVLVNNAGASWSKRFAASTPEEIARLVEVNLLGAMVLTRAALPGMLERRHGAIITVGSIASRVAMEPIYSATKFGLRGFSLALRRQLAGTGVSVSLVTPGNIRTEMTSGVGGRLPEPAFVASTVADLVLSPKREVILPRKHYVLLWLDQLLPRIADRAYHARNWSRVS
jgi:short-subunit dehydrogenase